MATKTEIYELRKKEENDFYNIEDFNNNMDTLEKALTEFDDSGTAEGVTSFPEMLTKLVTGNKLAITLKNLKAGLQFVLHAGSIVNNCVTDNANLPVSAAMAKSLQDQINQANSNLEMVLSEQYYYQGSSTDGVIFSKKKHNLIICKHDGGSSYLMGLVTNGSFVSILGNGNDFSVTVKNREITVISTAPYWYVLLI